MDTSPPRPRSVSGVAPVATLVGLQPKTVETDRAVIELEAGPQHWNPLGTVHGGIYCDLADYAMGMACLTAIPDHETFTTVEMKINFFRPFRVGKLTAEARVVRRGRTIVYVECEIFDEARKLIAKAASTCMMLRGDKAEVR